MECLARIGSWKDKGSIAASAVGGSQQRPLLLQAPFGELVSASSDIPLPLGLLRPPWPPFCLRHRLFAEQEESCYDSDLDDGIPRESKNTIGRAVSELVKPRNRGLFF